MYTYPPRTVEQIKNDLADLRVAISRAHDDDLPDMWDDYAVIVEELSDAETAETAEAAKNWREIQAPTGGLDMVKVARAFGPNLPKDWDE